MFNYADIVSILNLFFETEPTRGISNCLHCFCVDGEKGETSGHRKSTTKKIREHSTSLFKERL